MQSSNWKSGPDRSSCWLLCLVLVILHTVAAFDCDSRPHIGLGNSFEAQIEATFSESSTTILIDEYYQTQTEDDDGYDEELTSVFQFMNNELVRVLINHTSLEYFYIEGNVCTRKLGAVDFTNVLPSGPQSASNAFIFTTIALKRLVQDAPCISTSNTTIRGIEAQHFQSKMSNAIFKNVSIDFYFTRDGWKTEDDYTKAVPLRVELSGTTIKTGQSFNHYYDYFYFKYVDAFDYGESHSVFETPLGIYCTRKEPSALPTLPLTYSTTIEFVNPNENTVKISKLWVDTELQMVRRDFHPVSYTDNGHSVTEIYNYRTGTVYTRDTMSLNCSYQMLQKADINDDDILQHILDTMNTNTDRMVDALKILQLDTENAYYNGHRQVRNIDCIVFIEMRQVKLLSGGTRNITFEYYFISDDYQMFPDRGGPKDILHNVPLRLEISFVHGGNLMYYFYNFFDFSDVVSYRDFDTSACYNQTKDMVVKITMKGHYIPSLDNVFEKTMHGQIAAYSGVIPYRVQHIHVEYNEHFVFVYANIIDPSPPETLFTAYENKRLKDRKSKMLPFPLSTLNSCATQCVEYGFCYGFELTSDGHCNLILTKFSQKDSGTLLEDSQGTTFYGRTVLTDMKWLSNSNIWQSLTDAVYKNSLSFDITEPNTDIKYEYRAYHVELLKGDLSSISLPSPTNQVSYSEEITVPIFSKTAYHTIWHDMLRNLTRLDQYITNPDPPISSPGYVTTIFDYNTGIAYQINKNLRQCTVHPISNSSASAEMKRVQDTYSAGVVPADQISYIDTGDKGKFKIVGQKTIRGVLCDVYETETSDYIVPGRSQPSETTLIYYFANELVSETTSEAGTITNVQNALIQMEAISDSVHYYGVHNYYDFDTNSIPMEVFDIKDCYEITSDFMFQISFQGDDVTAAKTNPDKFIQVAQYVIAKVTTVEPLRIQEPVLEYDDKLVYFTAKLLPPPPIKGDVKMTKPFLKPLDAINKLKNYVNAGDLIVTLQDIPKVLYKAVAMRDDVRDLDTTLIQLETSASKFSMLKKDTNIVPAKVSEEFSQQSVDDCAGVCLALDEDCAGFGFCLNQGSCYLTTEFPDTHPYNLKDQKGCLVYNRNYINEFNKHPGKSMVMKGDKSVDADNAMLCAKQCSENKDFPCESFEYCENLGECTLGKVHIMDTPDTDISFAPYCDIYSRKFISEFHATKDQTKVKMDNDEILGDLTLDQCAKACMEMEDYKCNSFDYCNNTLECRLVYKDVQDIGKISFEKSAVCNHYSRIPGTFRQYQSPASKDVYSKAAFVRVAFILLFCGILLGIIGMGVYIRRQKRIQI